MKNYKSISLSLALFAFGITCVQATLHEEKAEPVEKHDKIIFDSFIINFVDGTQFINIKEILDFARHVLAIVNGAPLATVKKLHKDYNLSLKQTLDPHITENGKVGLIWFDGSYRTLKWLREYEKNNVATPEYKEALTQACHHFAQFSSDYIVEVEAAKGMMVKLIDQWSKLRNKPHTLLLDWSNLEGAERDALFSTMTSFEVFDIFLCDLLLFLKDLVHNCPKSYQKYQEQMKQNHNGPKRTN